MNGHWVVSEHWSAAATHLPSRQRAPAPASATQALSLVQPVNGGTLCASVASEAGPSPTAPLSCSSLAASAVSGHSPPAGPEWRRRMLPPLVAQPLAFDKPLCASKDGFTLHAATRAGALDPAGREALCKYVLRPAIAQERITHGPDGLVRIALKRPFSDGTVAIDLDPLSLLCRLAASVPPPRLHTVRYAGVLAPASKLRARIVPTPVAAPANDTAPSCAHGRQSGGSRYRPWAELLKRTFEIDVLQCARCKGRMQLVAMVTDPRSIQRMLRHLGEPTDPPVREPARGPPYWKSRVLRRSASDTDVA